MTPERYAVIATWLLRIIGASVCLAVVPVFFPLSWMNAIHAWLGLGQIPDQPIFEYLARSLSAMYFAHGCLVLLASTNVHRYLPFVWMIGGLNVVLGALLLAVDLRIPMPWFWTWLEGPPILTMGLLVLWASRGINPQPGSDTTPADASANH